MKRAATLLVVAYGLVLVCSGCIGLAAARWELTTVLGLDAASLDERSATFLNQYRFLKAVEIGGGLFCLMLLRPILDGGAAARVFLVVLAGGIAARGLAWAADGRPSWPFIVILALEVIVLAAFVLQVRRRHAA